ncbi:protein of unknown function [Algoriphagus locisalis]|uniref:TolB-like 6-blade propeller-like n=1 Tax=Algoriphagus locisalis TaxID=305507 RepID=A0A1I7ANR0_9BACT|nr:DUF4221 family protein [Algoriphagus locisalis]SFT76572.1 protein of unknown function [Algoriphagus locisalis]
MKKLSPILILIILTSCGGKESQTKEAKNILRNFSLKVDTVQVDVGNELFVPGSFTLQDFNTDLSKAYHFYSQNEIHEIDINSLKLVGRHVFEEDGPDLIPQHVSHMQLLPNKEVFFSNYTQLSFHKLTGEKLTTQKLLPENIDGIPNDARYSLTNSIHISPDKSIIVSLPNNQGEPIEGLAVINMQEMIAKILPLPALELTSNFQIVWRLANGPAIATSGDHQKIQLLNDKFLIYSGSTSDIYSYQWKTDSLKMHTFPHRLVPLKKTGSYTTEVRTAEDLRAVSRTLQKEITYGQFYWDETRNSYFRFAFDNKQFNDMGGAVKAEVYLFSYDENLNLTGESKVSALRWMPTGNFMSGGKLYMNSVQGENPAYIRYTFNF